MIYGYDKREHATIALQYHRAWGIALVAWLRAKF